MEVSCPNNVKIYNLSAGKSLPEWLSEKQRRKELKKNANIRRHIELLQDFDMPAVSSTIRMSKDGQYVLATGIYKPRLKCFDVNNLSLKFERCFDSEVVTFDILSDDYSKVVFLHCDRHIEFHAAHGRYHRLRIPRFGRDLAYQESSCDLCVVGVGRDIYRINLERGQFLKSYETDASSINKCEINPVNNLLVVGTQEGKIEAWDSRVKKNVGTLDCGFHCIKDCQLDSVPSITSVKFQDGITMAVGTVTGQILLYDLRLNKPLLIKDHMYGLPIRNIEFHHDTKSSRKLVCSMDSSIVKIWEQQTGELFTSIEAEASFNDLCIVPGTGMMFMANEAPKMQTYYIPSLGPAPKWSGFLDNLTEELEETNQDNIYDDYKFLNEKELEDLGLDNLKGTKYLHAHMHGYFVDSRLYKKRKDAMNQFVFDDYKKKKIREIIKEDSANRVQVEKLPDINKKLAFKLMNRATQKDSLLKDDRFSSLWSNSDFQVDENCEEFVLKNPVITHLDKSQEKRFEKIKKQEEKYKQPDDDDDDADHNSDDDLDENNSEEDYSSSDDGAVYTKEEVKKLREFKRRKRYEEYEKEKEEAESAAAADAENGVVNKRPRIHEMGEGTEFRRGKTFMKKRDKSSLGDRLKSEEFSSVRIAGSRGNREMTFTTGKRKFAGQSKAVDRRIEHKGLLRPAGNIGKRKKF